MLLCRWCLDLALGGEAGRRLLQQSCHRSSHCLPGMWRISISSYKEPWNWTDTGRTLPLLIFQVLELLHESREPYLLYWKQQFTIARPALTGSKRPEYWASHRTLQETRALRSLKSRHPVHPVSYFQHPQTKARSKEDEERLFSYWWLVNILSPDSRNSPRSPLFSRSIKCLINLG